MDWDALGDVIIRLGAVVTALTAISASVAWVMSRLLRQLRDEIKEIVKNETKELRPNAGSSIKDEVSSISERIDTIERKHTVILERLSGCPARGHEQ